MSHATRQRAIGRTLADTLDPSPDMVGRILAAYDRATDAERTAGAEWYPTAHRIAQSLPGVETVITGAGILAALSPQLSWADNVAGARNLCETGSALPAALTLHCDRASVIRNGAAPLSVLGGRKVRSFYRNILEPHRAGAVTIDRHALAIASPHSSGRVLERAGGYAYVAGCYRTAARSLSLLSQEVQAITWLCHRRELDEAASSGWAHAHRAARSNPTFTEEDF